jgi:hypothetical protein
MNSLLLTQTIHEAIASPEKLPSSADLLTWIQSMDPGTAALYIIFGGILLLFGYTMHRTLITITAALLGAYLGYGLGHRVGMPLIGMAVLAVACGAAAWMWTALVAALVAAVCGALLGSAIWQLADLNPQYAWSGALSGAIALGLLCFILFRLSVILFTSLQGAVMLVIGGMGMAWYYPTARDFINERMAAWPLIIPATILALTLIGFAYQHMKSPAGKGSSRKSSSPAPAKASAGKKDE